MPAVLARGARIAILGFGHVGSAVAERLASDRVPGLHLTHIFDRRAADKRRHFFEHHSGGNDPGARADGIRWTDAIEDALSSDADIVVEALGGLDPAREWISAALARGKSVVTANKQVIARHGRELLAFASRQGRQLRFEAAVGGAMPIVGTIREALTGDRITRIEAVLNGTSTFVLSQIERHGCTLAGAVREAQARGLAEADPSADLDGHDAAAKLAILCGLAFGIEVNPDRIDKRSIDALRPADFREARGQGRTIRQVASAQYDPERRRLSASVAPTTLPHAAFLARCVDAGNAAVIRCERAGDIGLFGCGAGGDATAVAVISDLLAIARDPAAIVPPPRWSRPLVIENAAAVEPLAEAV